MDPLSHMLSLLKVHSHMAGGFDAGGAWSLAFPAHDGIKLYAALSGEGWVCVEGVAEPVQVKPGDCFLLPRGRAFRVASDLALAPVDALAVLPGMTDGGVTRYNGGGQFFCAVGFFGITGEHASVVLGMLPPIVHIRNESDKAVLRWCVERMRDELRNPQPGGGLIAQQLGSMLLVQALRLHLADGMKGGVGWLFALADKQMAAAMTAMHDDPSVRWTVQSLADHVGMSRTVFTQRFKDTVGQPPMAYLTQWRMLLASDRLTTLDTSISVVAASLGYDSDSAFKRVMGRTPRSTRRSRTT